MKYNHRATSFDFFYKREISKKQKWFLTNIQFFIEIERCVQLSKISHTDFDKNYLKYI